MKEIWKDIKGYEELYQVSNKGRIRSNKIILKPGKIKSGYLTVSLWKNNKGHTFYVHRIVASTFLPNPSNKKDVNHIDGNKENNECYNLEWATPSENAIHAHKVLCIKAGWKGKRGVEHIRSKAVQQLQNNVVVAEYGSVCEAQRETNIDQGNISCVCNGYRRSAGGFQWRYK